MKIQRNMNQYVSCTKNNLRAKESNHWDSQPVWIKVMMKIWIALELGWYAGWLLHVINML